MINKDKKVCDKFNDRLTLGSLVGSSLANDVLCDELFSLVSDPNLNDETLIAKMKYIQNVDTLDDDVYNIMSSLLLGKNNCDKVDVLSFKLECYGFLYKDEFLSKFNSQIYKKLTQSKYLSTH
jgi:hypothetical protein